MSEREVLPYMGAELLLSALLVGVGLQAYAEGARLLCATAFVLAVLMWWFAWHIASDVG